MKFIRSLQELTLSIKWPPPRFELIEKSGAAHDAVFTMSCYVWCYKSMGRGKSKKNAKREAAASMHEILKNSREVKDLWQKRCEVSLLSNTSFGPATFGVSIGQISINENKRKKQFQKNV